ncbi:MAG TPA: hypothetical protein VGQ26_17900 [Streptosporangiaceae bacterium]|jgi:hypothetical protein|nr:hypothetical protein [Streptosporangiaceae bacterium]
MAAPGVDAATEGADLGQGLGRILCFGDGGEHLTQLAASLGEFGRQP